MQRSRAAFLVALVVLLSSCSDPSAGALNTLGRREVPVVDNRFDVTAVIEGEADVDPTDPTTADPSGTAVAGEQSSPPTASTDAQQPSGTDTDRRSKLLGSLATGGADRLCQFTIDQAIYYSGLSSVQNGKEYIVWVRDIRVVADYRTTFPIPKEGEKVVMLKCTGWTRYSIDVEAQTDFYMLFDWLGQTRVRFEPDNSTAKVVEGDDPPPRVS